MADADRASSHPVTLLDELAEKPYTFDFFQAVRRMDCAHPDKPKTGESVRLVDDTLRFGQEPSLIFAPATLESLERPKAKPPRLIQRFFGLFGPQGPLPLHITEYVRERIRNHGDHTLQRFLDIFHHRMTAMFYRAWARVRPTVSFDQPKSDRFSDYVGTLFGLGMRSLENRNAFPDLPKRHFSGLMSCQTHHAEGLLAILSGYFRLPVQLQEYIGQWIELPSDCRCLLGESSASLGVNTTVGSHVWDCQQKFRVIFGPLRLDDYYRMLPGGSTKSSSIEALQASVPSASGSPTSMQPGGSNKSSGVEGTRAGVLSASGSPKSMQSERGNKSSSVEGIQASTPSAAASQKWMLPDGSTTSSIIEAIEANVPPRAETEKSTLELWGQVARSSGVSLDRLMSAVRSYVGDELQWDLQLILKKQDTPPIGLGIVGRLGWSSWLLRDPIPRDPDDLVLDAMNVPDNVESVQFARINQLHSRILGQTRDGQYILASINADGSSSSDLQNLLCDVTTVDPAVTFLTPGLR
jgi:type VI secretion system protein ImpH